MKLYQISIVDDVPLDGARLFTSIGDAVTFDGERYVQLPHGTTLLKASTEWHETPAAARRAAADRLTAMAVALRDQAVRLLEQPDAEVSHA